MAFWHNQKYEILEQKSLTGDHLRGLPAKKFPMDLAQREIMDTQQDKWNFTVTCFYMVSYEFSSKIQAKLKLKALCVVSDKNLQKMRFEADRLHSLENAGWNFVKEQQDLNINCDFTKLDEQASKIIEIYQTKILAKYVFEKKKEEILKNIRKSSISNFSY
jgi:hypothetical protein